MPHLPKTYHWVLLLLLYSACQGCKQKAEDTPDAVRDLLIDRSFWETINRPNSQAVNLHRLTITNTSHRLTYRRIEVRFDYYDHDHHKIDSSLQLVDRILGPRAAVTIGRLETSPTKAGTTAAVATIVKAAVD